MIWIKYEKIDYLWHFNRIFLFVTDISVSLHAFDSNKKNCSKKVAMTNQGGKGVMGPTHCSESSILHTNFLKLLVEAILFILFLSQIS